MIWGWIICSFFTILVGLSLGEICSSYPTAGSVYHWAGILASQKAAAGSCYICGWFNFLGNAAGDAAYAFGFAEMVAAAIALGSDGETTVSTAGEVGIAIGISFIWALKNTARVDH